MTKRTFLKTIGNKFFDLVSEYETAGSADDAMRDWASRAMEAMIPSAQAPAPADGEDGPDESQLQVLYRPVWFVKKKLLTGYICSFAMDPIAVMPDNRDRHLWENPGIATDARLDLQLLRRASADLKALTDDNQVAVFIVPVHFPTVDRRPYRDDFARIWQDVDETVRRLLVLELVDVPDDLPRFRMQDVLAALRRGSRAVIVRVSVEFRDFARWKDTGLHAVSLDLSGHHEPEVRLMKRLDEFAKRADKNGLRIYIHGLPTISLTTAAVCAGFDYLDGDTVTSFVDRPAGIRPFEHQMIHSPLLEGAAEEDAAP